ncbi:MAG: prolyl oligopeptidase family serine peptidase, partial [Colwelliaceae bacterium]|nr:prolyl oligopeptidase family serine peptidase [Colwelliaceae bacterium]
NEKFLNEISPIKHVDKINIPVLLIHGTDDKVVSVEQSEDIFDALKSAKKEVKYIPLKMVGHHFKTEKTRLKVLKAIDDFVHQHLR